jgi:hypothetical protein
MPDDAELRANSESAKRSLATAKELRAKRVAAKEAAKKDPPCPSRGDEANSACIEVR